MLTITVITPTWQRHQLLLARCIPSVANQTIEAEVDHIVVSDGPDPTLRDLLAESPVTYLEVEEHHEDAHNVGGWARNHGLAHANGDLVAYLDDDNAFRPNHLEVLALAMLNSNVDFAYSRMERHVLGDVVGSAPPEYGCIDSSIIMHRQGTPNDYGWWPAPSEYHIDWQLIEGWLSRGATWTFVPEITVDYYPKGAS